MTEPLASGLAVPLTWRLAELELRLAELELRLAELELRLAELELRLAELELRLAELELQLAEPIVSSTDGAPPRAARLPREQLTGLLSQLAAMPREQLLDLLINRLRSALPPGTQIRVSVGPRFHLIQIPQARPPGSGT